MPGVSWTAPVEGEGLNGVIPLGPIVGSVCESRAALPDKVEMTMTAALLALIDVH
jgi:hypothetical protein